MAGSGDHERALAGFSKGGPALLRSLDYPCTARLRLRRLLAYHRRYSYDEIYEVARDNLPVIFDVRNLVKNIKFGQWRKASVYVLGFVRHDSLSYECSLLLGFLQDLMALNDFADGKIMVACLVSKWFLSIYKNPALPAYPCFATLVADILFLRSDHARAFLKWQLVKNKAAEMAEEMAYKTPELKDRLHFPRGPNNLYHVAPIGSSFRRRRIVKNLDRQQSTDLAQFYLQLKKRLPSSNQGGNNAGSEKIQEEPLIALLEKALQVGRHSLLEQGHPPEYPSKEDFPLMQMLTRPPFLAKPLRSQVRGPESSKQDTPQSYAVVASTETRRPPEYPSREGFPLMQMLARPPFLIKPLRGRVHSSKQDIPQSSAVVASTETNSAMKRMSFQEFHLDVAHPGSSPKRPRTTDEASLREAMEQSQKKLQANRSTGEPSSPPSFAQVQNVLSPDAYRDLSPL